jgi:DNA-binding NarL/FixJ family response regulator
MPVTHKLTPIRIGLIIDEPIRMTGLASIFEQPASDGQAQLLPVTATLQQLLADNSIGYLVIDFHDSAGGLESLNEIRRVRPSVRLIVIGPEGNDELIMDSIIAGARAYLDLKEGPEMVRKAIEVVTEGSIWAPRRLLSQLIDRLLRVSESSSPAKIPYLTTRERQVLELILKARSNREIASELGIEERTVKHYVAHLMKKTGADNRIKLTLSALSRSLVSGQSRPPGEAL